MDAKEIKSMFNSFAGKEVQQGNLRNDPVIQEIEKVAKDNGLTLWYPGEAGLIAHNPNRVSFNLEEVSNGKGWSRRIGSDFSVG